jgi:hypothetical protein
MILTGRLIAAPFKPKQMLREITKAEANRLTIICDHGNRVHPETISEILLCVRDKKPFALACAESAVIFFPNELKAVWLEPDTPKVEMLYVDLKKYVDGINLQLVSHDQFISTEELKALLPAEPKQVKRNVLLLR